MAHEATLERMHKVMRNALRDVPEPADGIAMDADTPIESLGFDSLTVLDLVYDLQMEFQIDGDVRDFSGLRTVGDLADYLEAKAST